MKAHAETWQANYASGMRRLTRQQFLATFRAPMQPIAQHASPPFDFWSYFDAIPPADFEGYDFTDCIVEHAYLDASGSYQHVLIRSNEKNIYLVLVLDMQKHDVFGHRVLDLNKEYGLESVGSRSG